MATVNDINTGFDYDRHQFVLERCRELSAQSLPDEPWLACNSRWGFIYDTWQSAQSAAPWAFAILFVGFIIYQCRAEIENTFVNGIAGLIKGKRRLSQNVSDTKARIAEKIDKAANE